MAPAKPSHDYYVILEVRPSATHEEIKAAYRRLARLHHPDKNGGTKEATIKTQLINVAWETLGDTNKRRDYDRCSGSQNHASTASHSKPSYPTNTPQSSWQPPRPSPPAPEDARAQAERLKKRQEWLNWEKLQEQNIRQCQIKINALQAEIAGLNAKVNENRAKLVDDAPYWWNMLASLTPRLSEKDKDDIRCQILGSEAAIRIKQIPLDREKSLLQQLQDELTRRRNQEYVRLAAEWKEKASREQAAREKAEAEARRRAAAEQAERMEKVRKEQLAREKAQAEARRRAEAERARQRAAQESREKAAREEAIKAEAARLKRMADEQTEKEATWKKLTAEFAAKQAAMGKMAEERAKSKDYRTAQGTRESTSNAANAGTKHHKNKADEPKRRDTKSTTSCKHKGWWVQIQGRHDCAHCTRPLHRFAYQCPGCATIACYSCREQLKAGITPSVIDNSHKEPRRGQYARSAKGKQRDRRGPKQTPNGRHDSFDYAAGSG
ncbi:Nn.00g048620.m01.CDS01 [Neocucurbitaria sp. VM-36]